MLVKFLYPNTFTAIPPQQFVLQPPASFTPFIQRAPQIAATALAIAVSSQFSGFLVPPAAAATTKLGFQSVGCTISKYRVISTCASFQVPPGTLSFNWGFQNQNPVQFKPTFRSGNIDGFVQPPGTLSFQWGFQGPQPFAITPRQWRAFDAFVQPPGTLSFQWGYHYQQPEPQQFKQPVLTRAINGFVFIPATVVANLNGIKAVGCTIAENFTVATQAAFNFTPGGTATPSNWGMFSPSEIQLKSPFPAALQDGTGWEQPAGTLSFNWGFQGPQPFTVTPRQWRAFDAFVQPPGTLSFNWGYQYQQPVQFKAPSLARTIDGFIQPPGTLTFNWGYQYQQPEPQQFARAFPVASQWQAGFVQPPGTLSYVTGYQYQTPELQFKQPFQFKDFAGFVFPPTGTATPSNWGMFSISEVQFKAPFLARAINGVVQPPGTLTFNWGFHYQNPVLFKPAFRSGSIDGFVQPPGTLSFNWGFQGPQPEVRTPRQWRAFDAFTVIPIAATPSSWGMFSTSPVQFKPAFRSGNIDGWVQPPGTLSFKWGFQGPQPFSITPRQWRAFDAFLAIPTPTQTPSQWGMFSQSPVRYTPRFINTGWLFGFEVTQPIRVSWGFQAVGATISEYRIVQASPSFNLGPPIAKTPFVWGFFTSEDIVTYTLGIPYQPTFNVPAATAATPPSWGMFSASPINLTVSYPAAVQWQHGYVTPSVATTPSSWGMFSASPLKLKLAELPRGFSTYPIFPPSIATTPSAYPFTSEDIVFYTVNIVYQPVSSVLTPLARTPPSWGMFTQNPPLAERKPLLQWRAFDSFVFPAVQVRTPTTWGMFSASPIKIKLPDPPRAFGAFQFLTRFAATPSTWGMFSESPIQHLFQPPRRLIINYSAFNTPSFQHFIGQGFLTANWLDLMAPDDSLIVSTWQVPYNLHMVGSRFTDTVTEVEYAGAVQGQIYEFRNYVITQKLRVLDRIIFTPLPGTFGTGLPSIAFSVTDTNADSTTQNVSSGKLKADKI